MRTETVESENQGQRSMDSLLLVGLLLEVTQPFTGHNLPECKARGTGDKAIRRPETDKFAGQPIWTHECSECARPLHGLILGGD